MICNSTGNCSISLKFGEEFDHMTLDLQQTFKVKRSKVNVTAWGNSGEKGIKSSIVADCSISVKFNTAFDHVTSDVVQMFKVKCRRSTSQLKNVGYSPANFPVLRLTCSWRVTTYVDKPSAWKRRRIAKLLFSFKKPSFKNLSET